MQKHAVILVVLVYVIFFASVKHIMAEELKSDGRFTAYNNGTVLDTKTGLMWAAQDNGADIEWQDAKNYCEHYTGGGFTGWRMPTSDELATLYDATKTNNLPGGISVHITELIRISSNWVWASTIRSSFLGAPRAADFDFNTGQRGWHHPTHQYPYRAIPVRFNNLVK